MMTLVLAMAWNRRGQAITLLLLALVSVAAAVAAPAYLQAADRAIAAGQVATAAPSERGLSVSKNEEARPDAAGELSFSNVGPALVALPNFVSVYASEYNILGIEPDPATRTRFVYRQDACPHLTMATGRCLIGEGEVVIGEATAKLRSLAAGDRIELTYAEFSDDPRTPVFLPKGRPKLVTIAGTYRANDRDEPFWGVHGYFAADLEGRPGEPVFADYPTIYTMDHSRSYLSVDSTAGPGALDVDKLAGVAQALVTVQDTTRKIGASVNLQTGIPELLARIDTGRRAARVIVPVIAVPLVLLACFVIFLAVGYGTDGRRPELAVVALRGARWWERWWLATGESLVPILLGALAGCLTGQLLVNAIAALRFPGVGIGVEPGWSSLRYAPPAALAAVLAALLAQRSQLFSPVGALLRKVPAARRRPPILELVILLLAVVTGVQLNLFDTEPTGAGLFAPALIIFALALIAGRALLPVVTRFSVRRLRRGRLGSALAGLQLSRRPGARGLFGMLVAAVAVAGYATCAADVGAQGREVQATLGTGADRVVAIRDGTPQELLAAVRDIDPEGRFAMAVAQTPGNGQDEPPGLAVDSSRLAAVATWPAGAPPVEQVEEALRPPDPGQIVIAGQDVTIEMTAENIADSPPMRLSLSLTSLTGRGSTIATLGEIQPGPYAYTQRVRICETTCRVDGLQITTIDGTAEVRADLILNRLGSINPVTNALTQTQLSDPARWRMADFGQLSGARDGLRIAIAATNGLPDGAWIEPADTPYPLPVASAGRVAADEITGLDGRDVPVRRVARLPAVPKLGLRATLTDLEYADRASTAASPMASPEVWLSPAAPADILDRLAARGLVVTADTRASVVHDQLARQGPALALWFYVLAGVLAIALAVGALILAAAVDRRRRVEDLSALRAQGVSGRTAGQAALWTYPILVVIAVLAGLGIALAGWSLTGWALPLAGLEPTGLPLPLYPRPLAVAATGLAVLVVLAGAALLTGRNLSRRVRAAGVIGGDNR
ncbi:MAG: FtsX-like permease family protein [Actinoplanes sp.]